MGRPSWVSVQPPPPCGPVRNVKSSQKPNPGLEPHGRTPGTWSSTAQMRLGPKGEKAGLRLRIASFLWYHIQAYGCIYIYMYIHIYIHICIYIYTLIFLCISTFDNKTFVYVYVYAYIYIYTYIHKCIHTYIHTQIYIYIYLFIYLFTYTQICVHNHPFTRRISVCACTSLCCSKLISTHAHIYVCLHTHMYIWSPPPRTRTSLQNTAFFRIKFWICFYRLETQL